MKPALVLYVSDSAGYGGAEKYQLELADECAIRGIGVAFLILQDARGEPLAAEARSRGFEADVIPGFSAFIRTLRRCSRTHRPIVHFNASWKRSFLPHIAYCRILNVPVVITEHAVPQRLIAGPGLRQFAPWVLRRRRTMVRRNIELSLADRVIFVGHLVKHLLAQEHHVHCSRGVVIPNGIDVTFYREDAALRREFRLELDVADDCIIVGAIVRLAPEKRVDLLIRAFGELRGENVLLVLAGTGEEEESLRRLCEDCGLRSRVRFLGWRTDVVRILSGIDVFALTSDSVEASPFSILEAMSVGKPVVATAVGGVPELVANGESGLLVAINDQASLAEALAALIRRKDFRRRLGEEGRRRAEADFSSRVMRERTLALYFA